MSDKSPTERVRELLKERGVTYDEKSVDGGGTLFSINLLEQCDDYTSSIFVYNTYIEVTRKYLTEHDVTPEQAIAVAVGGKDEWEGRPFVEYAEHVAKKLGDESFELMECCDEPDFSAIGKIYGLCCDIVKAANTWRQGKGQYDDELDAPSAATVGAGTCRLLIEKRPHHGPWIYHFGCGYDFWQPTDCPMPVLKHCPNCGKRIKEDE